MVIYIAGPFRGKTSWEIEQNVRRAEEASLRLIKEDNSIAFICPHTMTRHFQGELPDEILMKMCLKLLVKCDVVYFLKGWENSEGSLEEHRVAEDLGMVIWHES